MLPCFPVSPPPTGERTLAQGLSLHPSFLSGFPGGSGGRRFRPWVKEDPLEEDMATHSSILAWKNPMNEAAWRATVHGVTKSRMSMSTDVCYLQKEFSLPKSALLMATSPRRGISVSANFAPDSFYSLK